MVLGENMLLMFHLWKRNKDPSSYVAQQPHRKSAAN